MNAENKENKSKVDESIALLAKVGRCWSPSFSPSNSSDLRECAFVSDLTGSPQVWRIALSGGFPEAVTAFEEQVSAVSWSPRGDWLAVESAPGGGMNAQIDLVRPDGSERRRLTKGHASNNWLNAWTKDGRYVLFSSNMDQADSMDSFRICIETGSTEKLAKNSGTGLIEGDYIAKCQNAGYSRLVVTLPGVSDWMPNSALAMFSGLSSMCSTSFGGRPAGRLGLSNFGGVSSLFINLSLYECLTRYFPTTPIPIPTR